MTPRSFTYWLQGYFEIQDNDAPLDRAKSQAILKKIKDIDMGANNIDPRIARSVGFIEGQLEAAIKINYEDVFAEATKNIKERLNRIFIHAIDPALEGQDLRRLHKPGNRDNGLEAMC